MQKRQAKMNDITSKTAAWPPADLRHYYLSTTVNAYEEEEHWPHIFTTLTNGLETGDPVPPGSSALDQSRCCLSSALFFVAGST
jgi:hypothetical protein